MARKRFYLSRSDRRGLCVLAFVLICIVLGRKLYMDLVPENAMPEITNEEREEMKLFEAKVRQDSLEWASRYESGKEREGELFYFNPNTADSVTLLRLGLTTWQVSNMMKYRRKGGVWRSPSDFSRLYGLSQEHYQRLAPYIVIPDEKHNSRQSQREERRRDSVRRYYVEKYPAGTVIDLNAADTTMFKRIPGIGSYYASKICRYRERLGGFISVSQIKEVEGLPDDVEKWLRVSAYPMINKININKATFKELIRHPYLDYEQVKVITNYRDKYGKIRSWQDLSLHELFDSHTIERLTPYFAF